MRALFHSRPAWIGQLGEMALCGSAVFGLSLLSHGATVALGDDLAPAIWPCNAVALLCLIRREPRLWPGFLASAMAGDIAACMLFTGDLWVNLGFGLCNLAEVTFCAVGLRRFVRGPLDLARLRHLVIFAALALAASVIASIGVGLLLLAIHAHTEWRDFLIWTLSDALGLMIVTPAMLAVTLDGLRRLAAPRKRLTSAALMTLLAAVAYFTFVNPQLQLRFLIIPVLILVAFETETTGAALGLLIAGLVAFRYADYAPGGHFKAAIELKGLFVQILLLTATATTFPVAAAITRRRELESSLASRAREFQMLADHSSDVILRIAADGTILYVSPSCRRFGYEPGALVGRPAFELIPPEDAAGLASLIAGLCAGEPQFSNVEQEQLVRVADGRWIWMQGSFQTIPGQDGRPAELVTQLRDISASKAALAALEDSEARYRLLADRSSDIIIRLDPEGIIRYASPACRQLGYEPAEMEGRPASDFLDEDSVVRLPQHTARLFAGDPEAVEPQEHRVRRKDGSWVWLSGNPSVLRNPDGQVSAVLSSLRDVSDRIALEDELRRKRADAEAASVAKSEFLANMSHEIRTPLTGIIGFSRVLGEIEGLPELAATCSSRIATASEALLTVVNDILDFSKIEAGQIELDPHPFEPAAFVRETLQLVQAQADARGLALRLELQPGLPAAVRADSSRLRQVMLNLLTNAIKFTDRGEVRLSVEAVAGEADVLRLSVSDTGVGIEPDKLQRLFQRFSQVDGSISRQYGGTGLGLAICRSLVEMMGGAIGVESAPGRGSTFWFTVRAPAAQLAPAAATAAADYHGRPARILVVDDVAVNRELVRTMLAVFGHDLAEAGSGAEAISLASAEAFDLILMDLQMPGMDGLAAARAIRRSGGPSAGAPIVALSANVLASHVEACREAGMDDHIGKPIDPAELLTKVAVWTDPERPPAARSA